MGRRGATTHHRDSWSDRLRATPAKAGEDDAWSKISDLHAETLVAAGAKLLREHSEALIKARETLSRAWAEDKVEAYRKALAKDKQQSHDDEKGAQNDKRASNTQSSLRLRPNMSGRGAVPPGSGTGDAR